MAEETQEQFAKRMKEYYLACQRAEKAMASKGEVTGIEAYTQWDRVGCVELEDRNGNVKRFKGLDFTFKITKVLGNYPEGDVNVRILGLKLDTMNDFITICNQQEALKLGQRVRVYAGYQGQNNTSGGGKEEDDYVGEKIIDSDIAYATIDTPPPEMWMTITGVIGFTLRFGSISVQFPNAGLIEEWNKTKTITKKVMVAPPVTNYGYSPPPYIKEETYTPDMPKLKYKDLCEHIVKVINIVYNKGNKRDKKGITVKLDYKLNRNPEIDNFSCTGTIQEIIYQLQAIADTYVFLESSENKKEEKLTVMEANQKEQIKKSDKEKFRVVRLSSETGLIGLPTVSNGNSLRCRMLLNSRLSIGDYIDLKSEMVKAANGNNWKVMRITHIGHFRGTEWYTDVECYDINRMAGDDKARQYEQEEINKEIAQLR